MDYFLLNEKSGELRTAKPLDREALPDSTGLITLTVRVSRILMTYYGFNHSIIVFRIQTRNTMVS